MSKIERARVRKVFTQPSRTKQSFASECDINLIMKRFSKVQGSEYLSKYNGYVGGQFGDFSTVTDYRSAIEQVRSAEDVFMRIPAQIRRQFGDDAATFLDFVQNPANKEELIKMGLVKVPVVPSVEQEKVVVP